MIVQILTVLFIFSSKIYESNLARLDRAIADKPLIDRAFEKRMDSLKNVLSTADLAGRILAADSLFYYYKDSNIDSANVYADIRYDLYRSYRSPEALQYVRFEQMFSQPIVKLISNIEEFEKIDTAWINETSLNEKYLSTGAYLYRTALVNMDQKNVLFKEKYDCFYRRYCEEYPDTYRTLALNMIRARDEGDYKKVLDMATAGYHKGYKEWNKAVIAYYIGVANENLGNIDEAVKWYAESALLDIINSKNQHNSLSKLSHLLASKGDNVRALRYLYTATEMTIASNYQHRFPEIAVTLSKISDSTISSELEKRKLVTMLLVITAVALMGCLLALAVLYRFNLRVRRLNQMVISTNRRLDEMNLIKESCLMRYMVKCTDYIRMTDNKMSELKAALKQGGAEGLAAELRKPNCSDSEFKAFYSEFDSTFLKIFPGFLDAINRNVINGFRWTLGRNGALPMELRVVALMKIGITKNEDIASFLNFPVDSIYTYRYKLKKSLCLGDLSLDEFIKTLNI